jgi:hypothetical protein
MQKTKKERNPVNKLIVGLLLVVGLFHCHVVAVDVVISAKAPNDHTWVSPKKSVRALEIEIDAQFSRTDVAVSMFDLIMWSNTNLYMFIDVYKDKSEYIDGVSFLNSSFAEYSSISFLDSYHIITAGTIERLYVDCEPRGTNLGSFFLANGNFLVTATDGGSLSVTNLAGHGNVIEIRNPEGAPITSIEKVVQDGNPLVVLSAICKPGVRYSLERSQDLKSWTNVRFITSGTNYLRVTTSASADIRFFRFVESTL